MNSSPARTASGFPAVLKIHSPNSNSLARRVRMASSSSRDICSGHQEAPAARAFSNVSSVKACGARFTIEQDIDIFVVQARGVDGTFQRGERDSLCADGTITLPGKFQGALFHVFGELLRLDDFVDEMPVLGALAADAVLIGTENVGVIPADFSLVGEARQPSGSGQNAKQG